MIILKKRRTRKLIAAKKELGLLPKVSEIGLACRDVDLVELLERIPGAEDYLESTKTPGIWQEEFKKGWGPWSSGSWEEMNKISHSQVG